MDKDEKQHGDLPASLQLDWDELPVLTDSEMVFFQRVMAGDDPEDAFLAAYPYSSGWAHSKRWAHANKMRRDVRIEVCIAAAYENEGGKGGLPKEMHMRQLERLRERALASGNIGAAVKAEELRGKVAGHYVERREDVTPIDPVAVLRKMAKTTEGEALARSLAAKHNIPWALISGKPDEPVPLQALPAQATDDATDE